MTSARMALLLSDYRTFTITIEMAFCVETVRRELALIKKNLIIY